MASHEFNEVTPIRTTPERNPDQNAGSIRSAGSAGSMLSIGSAGSILSIGSAGSILSIGSAGSMLSIGSVGSFASVGSVFSVGSLLSVLAAFRAGPWLTWGALVGVIASRVSSSPGRWRVAIGRTEPS